MAQGKAVSFRIQHIPANFTFDSLLEALRKLCEDDERLALQITGTLSPSCYLLDHCQVAIVQFNPNPPKFLNEVVADRTGSVEYQTTINSSTISFDKNFFGLTQMFKPQANSEITVDIVAVTGLDGNAFGSWKSRSAAGAMWLKDFLIEDMPRCRVMTFGYNTKLASNRSSTFEDFYERFLEEILAARSSPKEKNRPLLLIGHSYGCRIITKSIVKCKLRDNNPSLKALLNAIRAVVFLGAPHRGMDASDIQDYLTSEFPDFEARQTIVSELERDNKAALQDIKDFVGLVGSFIVISIYERKPSRKLVKNSKAADKSDESANIPGVWSRSGSDFYPVLADSALLNLPWWLEIPIPSESDHSNIAKFDHKDATYQILLGHLKSVEEKPYATLAMWSDFLYSDQYQSQRHIRGKKRVPTMPSDFWLEKLEIVDLESGHVQNHASMLTTATSLCCLLQSRESTVKADIKILQDVQLVLAKARTFIILAANSKNRGNSTESLPQAHEARKVMAAYIEALRELISNLCKAEKVLTNTTRDINQQSSESLISLALQSEIVQSGLQLDKVNSTMSKIFEPETRYLYDSPGALGFSLATEKVETLARMSVADKNPEQLLSINKGIKMDDLWVPFESLYFQTQIAETTTKNRADRNWLYQIVKSFTSDAASKLRFQQRRYGVLKRGERLETVMVEFRPYYSFGGQDEYHRRRWQVEQLARVLKSSSGDGSTTTFPCVPFLCLSDMKHASTGAFLFIYSAENLYGLEEVIDCYKDKGIIPSAKERLNLATSLTRAVGSLHVSGFVHGGISLENLYVRFPPPRPDQQPFSLADAKLDSAVLLLAGFEIFREFGYGSDKIDVVDPVLRVYLHEDRLWAGDSKSVQYPVHDVYSLGITMIEFGLWQRFKAYPGYQKAKSETERRKFAMSLRRLFKDEGLEGDGQNMGSTYGAIISYCLGKLQDLDIEGTVYTNTSLGSPNALRAAEALVQLEKNVSKVP